MDKTKKISLIVNAVLIVALLLLGWYAFKKCAPCNQTEIVKIQHDTVPAEDKPEPIIVGTPKTFKVVTVKQFVKESPSFKNKVTSSQGEDGFMIVPESEGNSYRPGPCDTIGYYCEDTVIAGVAHVIIDDTVQGKILGRSVWFANLKPTITTTVTTIRKERVKFYAGASVIFNANEFKRWGAGPSALLTFPKGYGFNYTYDAHNNAHQGTFYYLIKIKK